MTNGVRLLPVIIIVAGLFLVLKLGGIWHSMISMESFAPHDLHGSALAQTADFSDGNQSRSSGTSLQLAQAQEAPALDEDPDNAFNAFDDAAPVGFDDAVIEEDEEELDPDIASLTPGEIRLLYNLADRRRDIEVKERELAEREALIRAAERQLSADQERLDNVREEIKSLVARYDEEVDKEVERLREIYSTMKARNAAAIFDQLDLDTLIEVVSGMSSRRVAPIIAAMNPQKAQQLTLELTTREDLSDLSN